MSTPATKPWSTIIAAGVCAGTGLVLFQYFGSAAKGYVKTDSLFWWWVSQWIDPMAESGHGWLILGLSAWLLWRNLRSAEGRGGSELACDRVTDGGASSREQARSHNFSSAVAAMLAGLALHALGFVAQQARLSILAMLLFTWGVLRLAGGRRWGAAAAFPLGFLVFAIPINVLDSLGFWLRVWVVDASAGIARLAGIGVLQSGTLLLAPDGSYNYDVAAACSGIRSLTAMAALSLLAGYLNFQSAWRRGLILLLCFPLVYVGNVARIVAIIFAAQAGGPKWGDVAHEVMGYGVFVIVLGGALGAISLLRRWRPEAPPSRGAGEYHVLSDTTAGVESTVCHVISDKPDSAREPALEGQGRGAAAEECATGRDSEVGRAVSSPPDVLGANATGGSRGVPKPGRFRTAAPVFIAAGIAGLAVTEMAWLHHISQSPLRGLAGVALAADGVNPVELPAFLGTEWIGRRAEVTAVEREILPPDTGYSRKDYVAVADPRQRVFLSVVLSGRDRTSIHRPELCLVGQGWTIAGTETRRLAAAAGPGAPEVPATVLRVRREVQTPRGKAVVPQLVAYWFVGGDRVVATHGQRMVWDAWNRVARGRADRWAYVLMQTDAADGEAAALARMEAVLRETMPVLAPQDFAPRKP